MATTPEVRFYLREWRKHLGLTQRELARRAGVNNALINRYETGERGMTMEMAFLLIRVLEIETWQFFYPPGSPRPYHVVTEESVEAVRRELTAKPTAATFGDKKRIPNFLKG